MKKTVIYLHGKGGSAEEAEFYRPLFPGWEVTGFDYRARTPREAKEELLSFFDKTVNPGDPVILIAVSLGAFLAMHALSGRSISLALLISPVADMEGLILNMMAAAGVSEDELRKRSEIPTSFGETLSWDYLCYVREYPLNRNFPCEILYGEKDSLISYEAVSAFARRIGAGLTVMKDGEHWFHTDAQKEFLASWIARCLRQRQVLQQ